jgi:UDP-N-acetyl-2-amino-2-deoxyglucuronate dehydrogenase
MPEAIKAALLTGTDAPHLDIYIDSVSTSAGLSAVSVADPSGAVTERIRTRAGKRFSEIRSYKDYRQLLETERPELVVAAYSGDQAPAVISAALESGAHVLAEKPACTNIADFEKLAKLAKERNRHLMLALATRLNPLVSKARELIQGGSLGKLYGATAWFIADQTRLRRPGYAQSWYAKKERAGGGHLIWLGIHYVDLLQYVTGQQIETVCGFAGNVGGQPIQVEDSSSVVMEFDRGMVATLQTGYYLDRGYHSLVRIWGSGGWLSADLVSGAPLEWHVNGVEGTSKLQPDPSIIDKLYPMFIEAAIDAARGAGPPPVTGDECYNALRAIFALYDASATGRTQRLS